MHPAIRAAQIRLSQLTPRWMKAARTHALIALADKMEPRMRNSFLRAVDEMKGNIDMGMLAQAIGNNDRLLAYTSVFEKKWPSVLASTAKVPVLTYGLAGGIASKGLGRIGIQTSFNLKSPEAINWARTNSSSLITNISSETRKGVQSVIGSAFDLGIPPKDAAKVIRDMVGLTEKQSIAASRYRDKISNQDRPADQVERMAARYESKLLRYRGETIARTEIIASAHQGQKEAWQQAVDEGLLDSSETNREWITTDDDRLCPICEPMNGQIVGLDEAFLDGDGEDVEEPPVHPNCRCTVGISFEAKTEQAAPQLTVDVPVANLEEIAESTADIPVIEPRPDYLLPDTPVSEEPAYEKVNNSFSASNPTSVDRASQITSLMNSQVKQMREDFEGLGDLSVKEFSLKNKIDSGALGTYANRTRELTMDINQSMSKGLGMQSSTNSMGYMKNTLQFGVDDSASGTVRHELGHAVHYQYVGVREPTEWSRNTAGRFTPNPSLPIHSPSLPGIRLSNATYDWDEIYDNRVASARAAGLTPGRGRLPNSPWRSKVGEGISSYSGTNKRELFAESWAVYSDPRYITGELKQLPNDVHEWMTKYIPRKKK